MLAFLMQLMQALVFAFNSHVWLYVSMFTFDFCVWRSYLTLMFGSHVWLSRFHVHVWFLLLTFIFDLDVWPSRLTFTFPRSLFHARVWYLHVWYSRLQCTFDTHVCSSRLILTFSVCVCRTLRSFTVLLILTWSFYPILWVVGSEVCTPNIMCLSHFGPDALHTYINTHVHTFWRYLCFLSLGLSQKVTLIVVTY